MTKLRVLVFTALVAACLGVACLCTMPACTPSATTTTLLPEAGWSAPSPPDPSAPHKLGMNLLNTYEVAANVAQMGFVDWNKTTADLSTTQDAGGTETAIGIIGAGPVNIPVGAVTFNPAAALTASDTNNAVLNVYKRNAPDGGGGTTQTLLASASTFTPGKDGGTGSWNPFTPVVFTLVAGAFVAPGDCITIQIAKNGTTGVSVPQGQLNIYTTLN
jgi:hypothetical protein